MVALNYLFLDKISLKKKLFKVSKRSEFYD